jgi:V/A-type H+-transporting ATPase subunit I
MVSIVFGFLYGSIFGIENVLPVLWIRPMDNIMQILIVTVIAGIVLLTIGFVTGMLNAWVARDWSRLFFDHNGLAGFLLYWSLLGLAAALFLPGFPIPYVVFVVLVAISGLVVMFSDLLSRLAEGQRPLIESGLATYAIQVVVELFETMISFLSNTLSYVRVGAFAVAHGGLSAVIFILATMVSPARGIGYWVVVVLGNLFIVGFEGMIVGIQTMRLEYYEFFSKFFTGGGVPYMPLAKLPDTGE